MMQIVLPTPARLDPVESGLPHPAFGGRLGVLDNSKPRFGLLARATIVELGRAGIEHDSSLYVRKPIAGAPADADQLDHLASGAVAVLVGSGD